MTATAITETPSPWRIFALLAGSILVGTLNFSLVFVAFSEFEETFHASAKGVSWTLTAFSITLAALMVPGGWLADRVGRKWTFLLGVALMTVGSGLVAIAPSLELLIVARMVQASGLALESPSALAILLDSFGPEKRSTAVGAIGGVGGVAAAFGPVIGGALIAVVGWRWAFTVNIPIGIATIAIGYRYLPNRPGDATKGTPDFIGVLALMAGVGSLALGIVQSDEWGWTSAGVIGSLSAAVVLLAIVALRSSTHRSPILEMPLFADRQFRRGNLLSILIGGNFAATFLTFIDFLEEGWGWETWQAGLGVAFIPAIAGPMSIVSGRLADRYGHRAVILPGAILMSLTGIWFATSLSYDENLFGLWLPAAGLYSLGVGLCHAASQAAAVATVPTPQLGVGAAMSRIFSEIGSTVGVAVVVTFLGRSEISESLTGVRQAMVMLIIVGALGAIIAASLPSTAEHRSKAHERALL